MRKKIEKGKLARCPYCGRVINYFFLYESKHYDFGHCSHCGGLYAVRYSGWAAGMTVLALLGIVGGIMNSIMETKSLPEWTFYLEMAAVLLVIYALIPLLIRPTKCVVRGKLGSFPDRASMPAVLREQLAGIPEENQQVESDPLSEEAKKMFVAFSPEEYEKPQESSDIAESVNIQSSTAEDGFDVQINFAEEEPEEPTVVASEINVNSRPLTAEERYRRVQKNRARGGKHSR